ncbi:hypothetical protein ACVWWG_000067 [Bradyrhizobium sp. LB7.2]
MNILIGAAMLALAGILIFIGLPNRTGEQPKFLRFEAALVLYPPMILSFIELGTAALISGLLTR